jgi:hypothetical protein
MKKVLAVVIAVAFISIGAVSSDAQVPNIAIYFDQGLSQQQGFCEGIGAPALLWVGMNNFNAWITTVEFATDFGPNWPLTYFADQHVPQANLAIGTSYEDGPGGLIDGVSISYTLPQNAFDPFVCMQIAAIWDCESCEGLAPQPITVVKHEGSGIIQATEWQTFRLIDGVGMESLVCPGSISNEETSWGRVKALYN